MILPGAALRRGKRDVSTHADLRAEGWPEREMVLPGTVKEHGRYARYFLTLARRAESPARAPGAVRPCARARPGRASLAARFSVYRRGRMPSVIYRPSAAARRNWRDWRSRRLPVIGPLARFSLERRPRALPWRGYAAPLGFLARASPAGLLAAPAARRCWPRDPERRRESAWRRRTGSAARGELSPTSSTPGLRAPGVTPKIYACAPAACCRGARAKRPRPRCSRSTEMVFGVGACLACVGCAARRQ